MAEKYKHIITSKKSSFYNIQNIKDELFVDTALNTQVNKNFIPDRAVNRSEPTPLNPTGAKIDTTILDLFSSRSAVAWLTKKEASALKLDPRVQDVERVTSDAAELEGGQWVTSFLGEGMKSLEKENILNNNYFSFTKPDPKTNNRTTGSALPIENLEVNNTHSSAV